MKKIMVEMWFKDDFVPPDYFEEPSWANNWTSKCQECPLFSWSDDPANAECHFSGLWEEKDGKDICPIKKYFVEEQTDGGSEDELKPCPFCGSKWTDVRYMNNPFDKKHVYGGYAAYCDDCCSMTKHFRTKDEAIEAWNRRVN